MSLDLTPGNGNLLGEFEWEILSPWLSGSWTLNTGVSPREGRVCSLSRILEDSPPRKYYLSRKACLGILRRARERGKPLPPQLEAALKAQAGLTVYLVPLPGAGAVMAGTADCLNPWDTQQTRIFTPEGTAPTLAGADGCGGRNPGGLVINSDRDGACLTPWDTQQARITAPDGVSPTINSGEAKPGGQIMELSEDVSGTLRAQEHGHQPLVFENHGIDARYTGPHTVAPTLSCRAGTGGNNLPLVSQGEPQVFCITGNAIDRQPENGGNGLGIQTDVAYTLTATDHHAVFTRQRVDLFQEGDVASTQSARQHKDATDLVYQETVGALTASDSKGPNAQYVSSDKLVLEAPLLIRRLTPRECERLQGFPDDWTALPGAADSPRYRALGNSVAIPCVEYLMHGMALVLRAG